MSLAGRPRASCWHSLRPTTFTTMSWSIASSACWAKHREYVGQGRETQRITAKQVLTVMANALNVEPDQWACVGTEIGQKGFWIRGNHFKPAPKFDVDAFKGKHGDWVHTLPYLWGTDPLRNGDDLCGLDMERVAGTGREG